MTHDELCQRAAKWLRNSCGCNPVMAEVVTVNKTGEIPDAIGWVSSQSIVVECKTSLADFRADAQKVHRRPGYGMGDWRFFLAQAGLLKLAELPEGWGLYEVAGKTVRHVKGPRYANASAPPFEGDKRSEIAMLRSFIARTAGSNGCFAWSDTDN